MVLENLTASQDHISLWKQRQAWMIKYGSSQTIVQKKNNLFNHKKKKTHPAFHIHITTKKFIAAVPRAAFKFDRKKKNIRHYKDICFSLIK